MGIQQVNGNGRRHPIGELLVGGDYACAEGDAATLSHCASQLSICFAEPYRATFEEISRLGHSDPVLAATRWSDLRDQLRDTLPRSTQEMPVAY